MATDDKIRQIQDLVRKADRMIVAGLSDQGLAALDEAIAVGLPIQALSTRRAATLAAIGRTEEAIAAWQEQINRNPHDPAPLLGMAVAQLRPVYASNDELNQARQTYEKWLCQFAGAVARATPEALAGVLRSLVITDAKPFFLPYQGRNDRRLQQIYGQSLASVMAACHPNLPLPTRRPPTPGQRWRVGFVSAHFYAHSVAHTHGGWVTGLNPEQFELFVYDLAGHQDATSAQIFAAAPQRTRRGLSGSEAWAKAILTDQLDALIYLDIGMFGQEIELAALRLAPLQLAGLGHPITTGMPTIDIVLSPDLMESPNGQDHYAEQLVRLSGLAMDYPHIPAPARPVDRQALNLAEGDVVFILAQSLFKFIPRYDGLLTDIALRLPRARFLFLSEPSQPLTNRFLARISQAFAAAGLDAQRHVRMHPRVPPHQFTALIAAGDVLLDTVGWSAHNTLASAIAAGLVPVTLPLDLMRSRHTAGALMALDQRALIAFTSSAYVEKAVEVGTQAEWRRTLNLQLQSAWPQVSQGPAAAQALSQVLEALLNNPQAQTNRR